MKDTFKKEEEIETIIRRCLPKHKLSKIKEVVWPLISSDEAYEMVKQMKPKPKSLYKEKNKIIKLINNNFILSLNWSFYESLIIKSGHGRLIEKYKIISRLGDYDTIKELSTYALNKGPSIDGFHLLVGIEQLYGYNYVVDEKSIYEKVTDWVSNKFRPNYGGSKQKFEQYFRDEVRRILNWKDGSLECPYSSEEFVTQIGLTGTSGSAYDYEKTNLDIEFGGSKLKYAKNKYAKSMALSVENKLNRLQTDREGKAKVSIKVEVYPKVRLIVSSDYNMTLKMRFIDTWLSRWMDGNKESTLWQTSEDKLRMWLSFCQQGDWNVPIDQSAFDHHVSKNMVSIMLDEIKTLLNTKSHGVNKTEYLKVMDTIIYGMMNQSIQVDNKYVPGKNNGTTNVKYESGVLSGWQWTAFLDTLANIAEKNMAIRLLSERRIDANLLMFNAQGDDQLTKFKTLREGLAYWAALSSMGFSIHITKNFFSNTHNEYLRKYSTREGMNGYPARMVNSIMWQYPGQGFESDKLSRLSGLKDKWLKLAERLLIPFRRIKDMFVHDAVKSKIDIGTINLYLSMKKVNGGAELIQPLNNMKFKTEGGQYKKGILINAEGFRNFQQKYGVDQTRELENWALSTIKVDEDDANVVEPKSVEVVEGSLIRDINLQLNINQKLTKPKIIRGVSNVTVVGTSDALIQKYYPDYLALTENTRAPRSWIKDWIVGKIKIAAPILPRCSDETSSMLIAPYKNSLYLAMFKKEMKGIDNRWETILAKADFMFKQMQFKIPNMFY